MKLYKPVTIESAEQAEALPLGTIAWNRDPALSDQYSIAEKGEPWSDEAQGVDDPPWWIDRGQDGATDAQMVGWTALVPIEAEEETVVHGNDWWIPAEDGRFPNGCPIPEDWRTYARLVTPWEEA